MPLPRRALVVGLARQGEAAALALARRGVHVIGIDRARDVARGRLDAAGVEVHLGSQDAGFLERVDVVVKSGGVPNDEPSVATALRRGMPVWSDAEVGARILPNPILGVTGTNGKTTTSALLGEVFRAAGRDVAVAGNIGRALCSLDGELAPDAWVVCELSSFQLEHVDRFRSRIGVLLNVEPDHLDRHGSLEAYRAAKLCVFANQTADDVAVVPRGFPPVPGDARRVEFHARDPLPAEPRIPGEHNRENAAAASAAARAAGIDDEAIAAALRRFQGVPHRLELVVERGGIRYVNDSKATNVAAALRAIAAFEAPLVLIAGGRAKGESFRPLAEAAAGRVRHALVIGEAATELAAELRRAGVSAEERGELADAVAAATAAARRGDVVLLSPACASYDQFANFEERGDAFRRLVTEDQ